MIRFWAMISSLLLAALALMVAAAQVIGTRAIHDRLFTYMEGILYYTPGYRALAIGDADRGLFHLLSTDSLDFTVNGLVSWSSDGKRFAYGGTIHNPAQGDQLLIVMNDLHVRSQSFFSHSSYWSVWNAQKLAFATTERSDTTITNPSNDFISVTDLQSGQMLYVSKPDDFESDIIVSQPLWSPDGQLFTLITSTADYRKQTLRIVNLSQGQIITPEFPQTAQYPTNFVWSPDGNYLAFYATDNFVRMLYIADSQGAHIEKISEALETGPAWSPDSQHIAYTAFEGSGNNIHQILYVIDIATRERHALTENLDYAYQPAWSPDGLWLAVISDRDGVFGLDRIDVVTGEAQRLMPTNDVINSPPLWSADGRWLTLRTTQYTSHTTYLDKNYLVDVSKRSVASVLTDSGFFVWQP